MARNKQLPLEKLSDLYQIAKGPEFYKSFSEYVSNKENQHFWAYFNSKLYRISDNIISFRLINHWEKEGIISNIRGEEGGWRRYSIMDIIWLSIIRQLRHFGIGLKEIKTVKKALVSGYNKCEYGELEFYTALVYLNRTPVNVLTFSDFSSEVATAYEIIDSSDKYGILNHISINLNAILQSLFPTKELKPIYRNHIEISNAQEEILNTIKGKEVEEIILSVKDGIAVKMDFTVTELTDSNIGKLKVKDTFQEIIVKQHKGDTVSIKRIISKKLNR